MAGLGQEINELVKQQFGSIAEFSRVTKIKRTTLDSIFGKESFDGNGLANIAPIARALELDLNALSRGKVVPLSTRFKGYVEVPLFGSIAAGQPVEPQETDERFPIPKELAERYPKAFLLKVSGTSMNRILPDGCYALVDPCTEIDYPEQPYAVTVGETAATVKRVRILGNGLELIPDSTDPTWRSMIFDNADENREKVAVIGRVVWYCLPINWRF